MKKVALITGAARGIGLASAKIFQENGYQVLILDRDESALNASAAEFSEAYPMLFDVSDPQTGDVIAKEIMDKFGRLDSLVNNAGVAMGSFFQMTSLEDLKQLFEINFFFSKLLKF